MSESAPLKPTLMSRLQLNPQFHRAIKALKLVEIASTMLSWRPLKRTLPNGTRYRVRYGESLLMADEIFKRQVYRDPFEGRTVKTFVDLGSNVGYFTCYAMERIQDNDAFGIAVDANPKMAEETAFHIGDNGWHNVKGISGVVGFPLDVEGAALIRRGTVALPANVHYAWPHRRSWQTR